MDLVLRFPVANKDRQYLRDSQAVECKQASFSKEIIFTHSREKAGRPHREAL